MSEELRPVDMAKIGSRGYFFDRRALFLADYRPVGCDVYAKPHVTAWPSLAGDHVRVRQSRAVSC